MDMITIHNLKKYYTNPVIGRGSKKPVVKALDGVDLTIARGKFTAIIGASGSGKTTLLNMMGGLDMPTEGEVIVDGINLSSLREEELAVFRRKKTGFIFQNYNLVPTLTVEENILFPLDLDGAAPDMRFLEEITELLGLADKLEHYPDMLSGGQQQRVAIARALASKAKVLLADEPTGNLDEETAAGIMELLKGTAHELGKCVIVVTHSKSLANEADEIVQIAKGMIADPGHLV